VTGQRFEAVWPVIDLDLLRTPQALIDEALDDLPALARQGRAELLDEPVRVALRPGRDVPGSGGAIWVVHAIASARPLPTRRYWKAAS
jgi:hypothetical protein